MLELKIYYLVFTMPYIIYLMVMIALMFSAADFYEKIRKIIFAGQPIPVPRLHPKKRFNILQGLNTGVLTLMVIAVFSYSDKGVDTELKFASFSGVTLTLCGFILVWFQINFFFFGWRIYKQIRDLPIEEPIRPGND